MTDETLRELLARVHQRLSTSGSLDAESREMLTTVMRDIDRALGKDAAGGGANAASTAATLPKHRVEALAVRFESDHPGISQLLRQIGALLGQAGI
jgi:hypothetical protein